MRIGGILHYKGRRITQFKTLKMKGILHYKGGRTTQFKTLRMRGILLTKAEEYHNLRYQG